METAGALWLIAAVSLLVTASWGSVCHTAVDSVDLGCLLRWDCPHASLNLSYTVQTKTAGGPWQDVPWCVRVSAHSCDLSQAFSNFELYNMIRLGVHFRPETTTWTEPCKFDYSDFTFSPPSVSLSLQDECLVVTVHFPCAANRRCSAGRSEGRSVGPCCPVSEMIDPWTTVTVYNQLHPSQLQSRTVWTQELESHVQFSDLTPGHIYCVEANFSFPTFSIAASPKSAPQCVETVSKPGLLPAVFLGLGLTSLILVPLLTVCLRKPRGAAPTPENPPKTPPSVRDPVSLVSPVPLPSAPVDPEDIHLDFTDDSIQSSTQTQTQTRTR